MLAMLAASSGAVSLSGDEANNRRKNEGKAIEESSFCWKHARGEQQRKRTAIRSMGKYTDKQASCQVSGFYNGEFQGTRAGTSPRPYPRRRSLRSKRFRVG